MQEIADKYSRSFDSAPRHAPDRDPLRVMIGIIRLADSIDAGVSFRPYKEQRVWNEIVTEIKEDLRKRHPVYHPGVVSVFLKYEPSFKERYQGLRELGLS